METNSIVFLFLFKCWKRSIEPLYFVFFGRKAVLSEDRFNFKSNSPCASKINVKEPERNGLAKVSPTMQFLLTNVSTSQISLSKWIPPGALSAMAANSDPGFEDDCSFAKSQSNQMEFNRVNCLVWVLHESARSFSLAMQTLELARTGPPVAMAWNGVDVHAWHKHIAYQVCIGTHIHIQIVDLPFTTVI